MKFCEATNTNKLKIESLQRWIIVHSMLYYKMDFNLVPDSMFDKNCEILVKAMDKYPKSFRKSFYYKTFIDFDGNTGFDLPDKLKKQDREHYQYLKHIAAHLKRTYIDVKKKR